MSTTTDDATYRRWLRVIFVVAALAQIAVLVESWMRNPFATIPINDAKRYWEWGADVAGGQLQLDMPYPAAPLYPHLVGLLRLLGGGLEALYVLQVALHLVTGWLVARIARRHFGELASLIAVVLFFTFRDNAYTTARALNATLQVFFAAWTWERALVARERFDLRALVWLGIALGLGALSNSTSAPLVLLVPAWLWWDRGRGLAALRAGAKPFALGLALISVGTIHNWRATGEFIPFSSQGGLAFLHGNQARSEGLYTPAEGISTDGQKQIQDMQREADRHAGGSWKGIERAFWNRGLTFWREQPIDALALAARKAWWFVSGRNYGDIYVPTLEIEDGCATALAISAPMPVALWTIPALVLILLERRRWRELAPGLLLLGSTLAMVVVFWYSPRYRLPATPAIAVFGAAALLALARPQLSKWRTGAAACALVAGLIGTITLAATGPDEPAKLRRHYETTLAAAFSHAERLEEALHHAERAIEAGAQEATAVRAEILRRMGHTSIALTELRAAVDRQPKSAFARKSLAIALAQTGDLDSAREQFEAALSLDPNDWEIESGLGNVSLAAQKPEAALAHHRRAAELAPNAASAHYNLGRTLEALGDQPAAMTAHQSALRIAPTMAAARMALVSLALAAGDWARGIQELRAGLERSPEHTEFAQELAWLLATTPVDALRDGTEARRLALQLLPADSTIRPDPALLDTLAAAQAECGDFEGALVSLTRCLEIARLDAPPEVIAELEQRLQLYSKRQPYRLPPR